MPQEQPAERARVAPRSPRCSGGLRSIGCIVIAKLLEQDRDRIAAGDEMIIGETEVERGAGVDGEETERDERTIWRKRQVELALDLPLRDVVRVAADGQDGQFDRRGPAAELETSVPAIENEAGQPRSFKSAFDAPLELRGLERLTQAHDMHGNVGVELAPAQHHGLEQIELAAQLVLRAGLQILQSIRAAGSALYANARSSHSPMNLLHVTVSGKR